MPVKGLTDRDNLRPRFPRLGKLRKGGKKPPRGFGKDLDYFRFTSDQEEVVAAFVAAYGTKPARLEVYLPYATPDDNFETWMEEWSAGGLVHRCDGETSLIYRLADGSYGYEPIPCPYVSDKNKRTKKQPGCVIVGRLAVVLPHLIRAGFVGYVMMETHSNHDLRNIMSTLLAVADAREQGLQGIPFTLRRHKETISTPAGNGKRVRRTKSLVALVPAPTWVESRLALARSEAFAGLLSETVPLTVETNGLYESIAETNDADVVEGGIEDDATEETAQTSEVSVANGHDNGPLPRPLDADWLRKSLHKRVETSGEMGKTGITLAQIPFLARKFQEAFADQSDPVGCYHTALVWLFEVKSSKHLTKGQAGAILDWLLDKDGPDDTGDTPLHQHAPEEALRVLRQALEDAGQADMFDDPASDRHGPGGPTVEPDEEAPQPEEEIPY